ncbi:MAG: LytTR family DNA-binding domain-containing protein [Erythrobacter sp.]
MANFFFIFFPEFRYGEQTLLMKLALSYLWSLIAYIQFYFFVGKPLHFLMSRNVPFVVACLVFFTAVAMFEAVVATFFFATYHNALNFIWHVLSTVAIFIPAIFICSLFLEKKIRAIYGVDPELVPFWLPLRREVDFLQALLPKDIQGKVLRLRSANQYVEVTTDKGTYELRATLKSILEMLPKNRGIHLHRSVWLHRDQIKEFGYDNGNPCVIDIQDELVPVSRNKVELVKEFLNTSA